jgi:hypothetical protein
MQAPSFVTYLRPVYRMANVASMRSFSKAMIYLIKLGAGEAIRTPDPNLGKVMLYP